MSCDRAQTWSLECVRKMKVPDSHRRQTVLTCVSIISTPRRTSSSESGRISTETRSLMSSRPTSTLLSITLISPISQPRYVLSHPKNRASPRADRCRLAQLSESEGGDDDSATAATGDAFFFQNVLYRQVKLILLSWVMGVATTSTLPLV
eukprot:GHVN01030728.1.p2 GENE.GHVN01030728.1~~GHVN01030728.1.p2  ORF type:complete len:150 (+),score=25.14 GHVN01030728.1:1694-2143(+)